MGRCGAACGRGRRWLSRYSSPVMKRLGPGKLKFTGEVVFFFAFSMPLSLFFCLFVDIFICLCLSMSVCFPVAVCACLSVSLLMCISISKRSMREEGEREREHK